MAVPKRKTSTARRDKRRTHWKLKKPVLSNCSHCGSVKSSHRVCENCGFYGGKEVFEPQD